MIRRLYDWVLTWADHRYAGPALFIMAFAEASFFPIPPDVLLMAMAVGAPTRALRFATICTIGSVLGAIAGYAMGWGLWGALDSFFYQYVPGLARRCLTGWPNPFRTIPFSQYLPQALPPSRLTTKNT